MYKRHGLSYKICLFIQKKSRNNCHKFQNNLLGLMLVWDKLWLKVLKLKISWSFVRLMECIRNWIKSKENLKFVRRLWINILILREKLFLDSISYQLMIFLISCLMVTLRWKWTSILQRYSRRLRCSICSKEEIVLLWLVWNLESVLKRSLWSSLWNWLVRLKIISKI